MTSYLLTRQYLSALEQYQCFKRLSKCLERFIELLNVKIQTEGMLYILKHYICIVNNPQCHFKWRKPEII